MMSSTCCEPDGISKLYRWHLNKLYYTYTYDHLPEDEPSVSKHVEDIVKIKILV
jgi:hypothetical protein